MENVDDLYPLTPTQAGILFHSLRSDEAETYLEQVRFDLTGPLDVATLRASLDTVIARHPMLRTMFVWDVGREPLQVVRSKVESPLRVVDRPDASPAELDAVAVDERRTPPQLDAAPVIRALLVRRSDERAQLIWTSHHLVLDGWSSALVFREWFECYASTLRGESPALRPASGFREYVAWLQRQDPDRAARHWAHVFRDFIEPALIEQLPVHDPIPGRRRLTRALTTEVTAALHDFARRNRVTVNIVMLAAWAVLVGRVAGRRDVAVGSTTSGRPADLDGVDGIVGMFSTTVPVRVRLDGSQSIPDWLAALQRSQADGRVFEHVAVSGVRSHVDLPHGAALFDSIFVFENYPVTEASDGGLRRELVDTFDRSHYGLDLMVLPGTETTCVASFDTERFDLDVVAEMLDHFVDIVGSIVTGTGRTVADLDPAASDRPGDDGGPPTLTSWLAGAWLELRRPASSGRLQVIDLEGLVGASNEWTLVEVPAAVRDDDARLVRFCAGREVDAIVVGAGRFASLATKFPELHRRLREVAAWTVVSEADGPDDDAFVELPPFPRSVVVVSRHAHESASILFARIAGPDQPIDLRWLGVPVDVDVSVVDAAGLPCRPGVPGRLHVGRPGSDTETDLVVRRHVDGSIVLTARTASSREPSKDAPPTAVSQSSVSPERAAELTRLWSLALGIDDVEPDADFFELGGRSSEAVALFIEIKRTFDLDLPLAVLFRRPTWRGILELIERGGVVDDLIDDDVTPLSRLVGAGRWLHLVEIAPGDADRIPLFLVHGAGGNILNLHDLSRHIGDHQPLFGFQALGVDGIQPPHRSLDAMVEDYLAEFDEVSPEGPFVLGGYSGGGVVALEMARRLRERGKEPTATLLIDTYHPSIHPRRSRAHQHLRQLVVGAVHDGERRSGPGLSYLRWKWSDRNESRRLAAERSQRFEAIAASHDVVPLELREHQLASSLYNAAQSAVLEPYDGPTVLIATDGVTEAYRGIPDDRGWSTLISDLTIVNTPGFHDSVMRSPHVEALGALVGARLDALAARGPDPGSPVEPSGSTNEHVFRFTTVRPVEHELVESFVSPGSQVLDVGTGATGRSALLLREQGAEVHSIELVEQALAEFAATGESGIKLTCADMVDLPFADDSFDFVLVAFHGFDYITDAARRVAALREFNRVTRPGGRLVFDVFNRVGLVCNPRSFRSVAGMKLLARHLFQMRPFRRTFVDANGLELHQATIRQVVRSVHDVTDFRLERATNSSGSSDDLRLLGLFAPEPYFVFRYDPSP